MDVFLAHIRDISGKEQVDYFIGYVIELDHLLKLSHIKKKLRLYTSALPFNIRRFIQIIVKKINCKHTWIKKAVDRMIL